MSAVSPRSDEWHIKGVKLETRRKIKLFALSHDLTLAGALDYLADLAAGPGADEWDTKKQSGTKADTQRTRANEHDILR